MFRLANNDDLTKQQIFYAAQDAYIGYKIFDKLIKNIIIKDNNINLDIVEDICFGIIDLNKSYIYGNSDNKNKKNNNNKNKKSRSSYNVLEASGSLLYDNCRILKPNGEFLSWCRKKTLDRYINKGYAIRIDETSIKLNFEPKKNLIKNQ